MPSWHSTFSATDCWRSPVPAVTGRETPEERPGTTEGTEDAEGVSGRTKKPQANFFSMNLLRDASCALSLRQISVRSVPRWFDPFILLLSALLLAGCSGASGGGEPAGPYLRMADQDDVPTLDPARGYDTASWEFEA